MGIDPKLLEQLRARKRTALLGGGRARLEKRHAKGQMGARERLDYLFEPGSFQEFGLLVDHDCHDFGMESQSLPGDGVLTGIGHIDGRAVAAFSQDFTVGGGALGRMHARKITGLMDMAEETGVPLIAINDSGGARIQEAVHSLSGYGQVFNRNVSLSGLVPQIAVIAGPCAGGAAYSPALMDFIIMTRRNASMFICGPEVIKAATGQTVTMAQVGSASVHASVSGNIHFIAEDDAHALDIVRQLLSYLPGNNLQDPPHQPTVEIDLNPDHSLTALVPEDNRKPLDALEVVVRLLDGGRFLEVQREWAKNILIGFGRIDGIVVGVVANQPTQRAGTLDIDASDKAARFIRFCNAFNIPLLTLVDVPGFLPGVAQERGGIIRHGAKMLYAYASATVPKITVILRKAYGGAYLAMCSEDMGANRVFAWPTAEIAVMGAQGATNVLYRREIAAAADPAARRAELQEDYRQRFASPYMAARFGMVSDVIEPSQTRSAVSLALRQTLNKRVIRPAKKHGLIPL
jgi:propionyl-CoA carboxylase beta chain